MDPCKPDIGSTTTRKGITGGSKASRSGTCQGKLAVKIDEPGTSHKRVSSYGSSYSSKACEVCFSWEFMVEANFFYPALGLGIAGFVVMLALGGPDVEVDFNSLITEGGIAYEPDSEESFDGKAVSYYPNGRLMYEAEYKDGKQHGKIISFYKDGSKQSEGAMENGIFHGKFIHYYPNGQKQSQYIYRNGNAISRENWDETGKVVMRVK